MEQKYHISTNLSTPTAVPSRLMTYPEAARAAAALVKTDNYTSVTVWAMTLECVTWSHGRVDYDQAIEPAEGAYIAAAIKAVRK